MAYYITQDSKGQELPQKGKAEKLVLDGGIVISDPTFRKNLVCILHDTHHDTACYVDKQTLFAILTDRKDTRPKTWLMHPKANIIATLKDNDEPRIQIRQYDFPFHHPATLPDIRLDLMDNAQIIDFTLDHNNEQITIHTLENINAKNITRRTFSLRQPQEIINPKYNKYIATAKHDYLTLHLFENV